MGEVYYVEPVIRFCAVISRHSELRQRAIERLQTAWGNIVLRSEPQPFVAGGYYTQTMGETLLKELIAFEQPIDSAGMADWKLFTNDLENEFLNSQYGEARPLNLDPGYITQAKLVLATTKDRDHRIYLRDAIFAEVTLTYRAKKWIDHRWTYPDYRSEKVSDFATQCRNHLRDCLKKTTGFRHR